MSGGTGSRSGGRPHRGEEWRRIDECTTPDELLALADELEQIAAMLQGTILYAQRVAEAGGPARDADWWQRICYARRMKANAAQKARIRADLMRAGRWRWGKKGAASRDTATQ